MTQYKKEFKVENEDNLGEVICPNDTCNNRFLIPLNAINIAQQFDCKKCGSKWHGRREEIKE